MVFVGVEYLAGADDILPPARLAGDGMRADEILIAGEAVAEQDGVGFFGVEFAVGLIGQRDGADFRTAIETERLIGRDIHQLAHLDPALLGTESEAGGIRGADLHGAVVDGFYGFVIPP